MAKPWEKYGAPAQEVEQPLVSHPSQKYESPESSPQQQQPGELEKMLFPSASKVDVSEFDPGDAFDYAEDPYRYGLINENQSGKSSEIAGALFDDIFSFLTRAAEGTRRMFTGKGAKGFKEAMKDPEASVFQGSREENAMVWRNLAENAPNPAMKKFYQTLGFLGQAGYGAIEDPSTYFSLGTNLISKAPRLAKKGVDAQDLMRGGLPLTPAQTGKVSKKAQALETYAQSNPYTQAIPEEIKKRQLEKLEETASTISKKMGGADVQQAAQGGSVRGALIEQKIKNFENINQKLFRKGEDMIRESVGIKPVNLHKVDVLSPSKVGLVDAQGNPIKNILTQVSKSNAVKKMENKLESIGHVMGQEAKNIGEINKKTIRQAEGYLNDIYDAQTIGELLNVKRNVADEVFDNVQKGFLFGDKNIGFLRSINKDLNDAIEESIISVSPGMEGEQLAGIFRSMNKQYESNLDAVQNVSKKLGMGREDLRHENVIGKIKLLGTKNLQKLQKAAAKKPEIKPIYEELQRGAYEDIIFNSLNKKTMQLSPDRISTVWNSMDAGMKKALFPPKVIGETDHLVNTLNKIYSGDIQKLNPSGTAKVLLQAGSRADLLKRAYAILSYPTIKHYYKTGKLPRESIWNMVIGPDGKFYLSNDKIKALAKTESVGNWVRSVTKDEEKNK